MENREVRSSESSMMPGAMRSSRIARNTSPSIKFFARGVHNKAVSGSSIRIEKRNGRGCQPFLRNLCAPAAERRVVGNLFRWGNPPITALLLFIIVLLKPADSQEFRASITGEVAHISGAVIPNATITAINLDTRCMSSVRFKGGGANSLLYLLLSTYTITAEAPQFKTMMTAMCAWIRRGSWSTCDVATIIKSIIYSVFSIAIDFNIKI